MKENHTDIEQIESMNRDLHGLGFVEEEDNESGSEGNGSPPEPTKKDFETMPADLRHLIEQLRRFHKLKDQ